MTDRRVGRPGPPTAPSRSDPALERDRVLAAQVARAAEPPASRRRPQQARSQAKVDALLDAADELVLERGPDRLTTTLVAAHAGVAVGSLYRYFDGIPALIDALAARHTERFQDQLAEAIAGRRFTRKRDAANAALDALVAYCRDAPGFRALWRGAPVVVGARFDDAADWLLALVVDALVAQGLAPVDDPAFEREARIQWATASALILLAFRLDPDGDPVVLAHLRHLFTIDITVDLGDEAGPRDRATVG